MPVNISVENEVALIRMQHGGANAINFDFIHQFNQAMDEAEKKSVKAAVITGSGRIFSAGLDLVEAFEFDKSKGEDFVREFDDFFIRLFLFPVPTVAAVNGHAIAGGAVIAMACDYRIMVPSAGIALNEVHVGIPFPAGAFEIARNALTASQCAEWLLAGRRFTSDEAHSQGIIQKLAGEPDLLKNALEKAQELALPSGPAVRAVKAALLAPVVERIEKTKKDSRERFLKHWFSEEGRASMQKIRDGILSRRK